MMGREERVCRNEMMRSGGGDDKPYGWEWSGEAGMEVMAEVMVEMVDVGVEWMWWWNGGDDGRQYDITRRKHNFGVRHVFKICTPY